MKLSHRELEVCYRNPNDWLSAKRASSGRPSTGFSRATILAIYQYHKNQNPEEALNYLNRLFRSYKLRNPIRRVAAENNLSSYIDWYTNARPIVASWKVNMRLPLENNWRLTGEISRIDIDLDHNGYRAILIGDSKANWRNELRMPLIQRWLAEYYQRDELEMMVGVQEENGEGLECTSYSTEQMDWAIQEIIGLTLSLPRL